MSSRRLRAMTHHLSGASRPVRGGWRLVRAGVLGGSSVLLAVGAHLLGGGVGPSAAVVALTVCLAGLIAVSVTARACRLPLLLTVLGLEQAGLHLLFGATSAAASCGPGPGPAAHGLHAGAMCVSPAGHAGMAEPGLSMVVAHVAAVIATAWLLARGERWVWALVATATAAVSARPSRRRSRPTRMVPVAAYAVSGRAVLALAPTRGPPAV